MGEHFYLQLTSIFDQKSELFNFQKNLIGRSLVACPIDHNIYFSPFGGNIMKQTDFSHKGGRNGGGK
jgi:hypothetical protein